MLSTLYILLNSVNANGQEGKANQSTKPRSGGARYSKSGYSWAAAVIILMIAILYYIGVCTIFSRANPKLPGSIKILVFILLLFFGDVYIVYFVLRMGINGIRGTTDYTTLPYPVRKSRSLSKSAR
jgi:hypothetical protein